jgi:hypothetical protein
MKVIAVVVGGVLKFVTFAKGLAAFTNELLTELAKLRELLSDLVSALKDLTAAFS